MRDPFEPEPPRARRRGEGNREPAAVATLRAALRGKGEVLAPGDAEEPILAPTVRGAIFGWLAEINARDELMAVGIKPRATGLLYGPPGCGKTTLAHHLAARLGIPLVLVGAENLNAKYWGESEQNVAKLFDAMAEVDTGAILFMDEIDAIGGSRDRNTGGSADNGRTAMLTVLLRKVEAYQGIFIGATNRAADLDQALWRRFGMQIDVALPDGDARYAILARYGAPFEFGDDALELLTDLTAGAAPSLLRQLMEGIKRLLVIGERIRQPATDPATTFAAVVASTKPHPDYQPPPLWSDRQAPKQLADIPWPPARTGGVS